VSQKSFKFVVHVLVEEFLRPITIETVAPPTTDRAVVDQLVAAARAAPAVTPAQLSAQEHFERAAARADDDAAGKISDYSEALRLNPEHAEAFHFRGVARADDGDLEGAIADYTEALRLNPESAGVFARRAVAHARTGDLHGAAADYREAARLNPWRPEYGNRAISAHLAATGRMPQYAAMVAESLADW
jgi:tetratricopeptide (TPR) repeat protein